MPSEAQARITINKMLEDAGWRFLPDGAGNREDINCEHRASVVQMEAVRALLRRFEAKIQRVLDRVRGASNSDMEVDTIVASNDRKSIANTVLTERNDGL